MWREVRSDRAFAKHAKEQDIDDVRVLIEAREPLQTRIVIARKPEEAGEPNASARCAMRARTANSSIRAV